MDTRQAVDSFVTAKTIKGLSPRTIESYRYRLGIFAAYVGPDLPTTPEPIEAFLAQTGPTIETRDTYFRLLRNFYRWLVGRKHLDESPVALIEAPRLPRKHARGLSLEELVQLLVYPGHRPADLGMVSLLANTGVRLGEALSVDRSSYRDGVLTVRGKVGERQVPCSSEVWSQVSPVLPWPWASYSAASHAVRRAFRRAGFSGKRASAHTLRHSFARLWEGDDASLVGIMGWTTSRMLSVYRPYDVRRAVAQHAEHNPVRLARQRGTQRQLSMI